MTNQVCRSCTVVITIVLILTAGCIGIVTEQDLIPHRQGNIVYVDAAPYLNTLGISEEIDVIYIDLGGTTTTMYAHTHSLFRADYQFGVRVPRSQEVHAVVDVLYVNGTTIRIYDTVSYRRKV